MTVTTPDTITPGGAFPVAYADHVADRVGYAGWAYPTMDAYRLIRGGIDADGSFLGNKVVAVSGDFGPLTAKAAALERVTTERFFDASKSGYLFSAGDDYRLKAVYVKLNGDAGFNNLTAKRFVDAPGGTRMHAVVDDYRLAANYVDPNGVAWYGALNCKALWVNGVQITTGSPVGYITPAKYNVDVLSGWHSLSEDVLNHVPGVFGRVALLGGSEMVNEGSNDGFGRGGVAFALRMRRTYGEGGPGWTGAFRANTFNNSDNASVIPTEAFWTHSNGWRNYNDPIGGKQAGSPDQQACWSTTVGSTATLTYAGGGNLKTIDFFHNGGGGTLSYAFNGEPATTITLPDAPGTISFGARDGNWACVFTVVSGTVTLAGANLLKASGLVIHNLSRGGLSAARFAEVDQAVWADALKRLGIDVLIISLAGNDEISLRTVAQFTADSRTLYATARTANPAIDIISSFRPYTTRAAGVPLQVSNYAAAIRGIAVASRLVVYDAQTRFGVDFSEYNFGSIFPRFKADNNHMNYTGTKIYVSGPCEILRS